MSPVGLVVALVGGLYLLLFSGTLLEQTSDRPEPKLFQTERHHVSQLDIAGDALGDTSDFAEERPLRIWRALASLGVFAGVVALAALNVAPIAAAAFAGAVLLILMRVIAPDEAYGGLRPEILLLIAGKIGRASGRERGCQYV